MKVISRYEIGFSVVELMIAITISIFITGAAGLIYVNSKSTFMSQDAVSSATESARFAIDDLRRNLVMASRGILMSEEDYTLGEGVGNDNDLRTFPAVAADNTDPALTANVIIDIDKNGSSAIAVRYAEGTAPCGMGGTIAATTTVRFYVNNNDELVCQATSAADQIMVSGVVRMRALYGVDLNSDGYANAYWTATQIDNNDSTLWSNVISIRIGLVVNSGNVQLPAVSRITGEELSLLGSDYTVTNNALFHKTVSTTILLRNRQTTVMRQ